MFVITTNGKTTVLTGWRAWLAGTVVLLGTWLVLAVIAFLLVGVAATVGAALVILVPAIIVVAIVASFVRR